MAPPRAAAAAAAAALSLLLLAASAAASPPPAPPAPAVLYIPLDERFTTRDAFLNMAAITPFRVATPPPALISFYRQPAPLADLAAWFAAALPAADAAVISLELLVYGGLITSRCSNDSATEVQARVAALAAAVAANPAVDVHLGTTVMRIPSYNEAIEEPWYWALYGADLYTYSFFLAKYNVSGNASDLAAALAAEAAVPPAIVAEFRWRRARNFNATVALLQAQAASVAGGGRPLFASIFITLDDNAQFGFNIQEAAALAALVRQLGLQDTVLIYPGADEVGLSMLARLTVAAVGDAGGLRAGGGGGGAAGGVLRGGGNAAAARPAAPAIPPSFASPPALTLLFRKNDSTSLHLIPNYEGQPMLFTLLDQVAAAGATAAGNWSGVAAAAAAEHPEWVRPWRAAPAPWWPASATASAAAAAAAPLPSAGLPPPTLLVNNFGLDEFPQIEAPDQTTAGRSTADYAMFTPAACGSEGARSAAVSMADNRYSNGADVLAVAYLYERAADGDCAAPAPTTNAGGLGLDRTAYAGWNTDGNTLGTAIANLVLLHYFGEFGGPQRRAEREELVAALAAAAAARRARWAPQEAGERAGDDTGAAGAAAAAAAAASSSDTTSPALSASSFSASASSSATSADPAPASAPRAGTPAGCTASCANGYFNLLRFVEDDYYQAALRQELVAYVSQVDGEGVYTLGDDLTFYTRFLAKVLGSRLQDGAAAWGGLNWTLAEATLPWNRTFECGLFAAQPAA
jgi:hypothetical protein